MKMNESGLMVYEELHDRLSQIVRVRRCHGDPPRVIIEVRREGGIGADPELGLEEAAAIRDALDLFLRRAVVRTDAKLPPKRFSPEPPTPEPRPGYAMGAPNYDQLLGAIHS